MHAITANKPHEFGYLQYHPSSGSGSAPHCLFGAALRGDGGTDAYMAAVAVYIHDQFINYI